MENDNHESTHVLTHCTPKTVNNWPYLISVKFRDEQKKKEEIERKKFQAIAEKREQDLLKVVQRNEVK